MITIANPQIGKEEKQAVLRVLNSSMLAQGPQVMAFEEAFAKMVGTKYAVATSSGTTALHTALLAHGIGPGDQVITTPFSFIASANSILYAGATPVFVDIDPNTFNLNPHLIEAAINENTKAMLVVHLFGLPAEMRSIVELAKKYQLIVIEDACQSHGAEYGGQKVGSFGTGCFSLYPTKNITAGEGGMITCNDANVAEMCRIIRQHGMTRPYQHMALGFNFRMTDIHAAIGLAQLSKLNRFNQARVANASYLTARLNGVITPGGGLPAGCQHVFNQYTIRVPNHQRDALRCHLQSLRIGTGVYYPTPIHQQPLYASLPRYQHLRLPHAERAAQEVLSLPVHPGLHPADLEEIVNGVNTFR